MGCFIFHKWDGCKCQKCGKIRDTGHNWQYNIYCRRCHRLADLNKIDTKRLTELPLDSLYDLISGLIVVGGEKKRSYNSLRMFLQNAPSSIKSTIAAKEVEVQNLLGLNLTLLTTYMTESMRESSDKSKTFDELIERFSLHPEQHRGMYNAYGAMNALQVLVNEGQDYLERI